MESLVTVDIMSDEEATATAADVHRMMTRRVVVSRWLGIRVYWCQGG